MLGKATVFQHNELVLDTVVLAEYYQPLGLF